MNDIIPIFRPSITQKEIDAVSEVLKSGWLGLGPQTAAFETEFRDYIGCAFAVGLNSGTAALHLALELIGIEPGDEVIVPTITFISSAHAVEYVGAVPVFADIRPDNLCIDPEDVERKISSKTRAVIPVHYAGHPCDMDELGELAAEHNITIVEDAAHACGARYRDRPIGSMSPLTCFSFHAVKNLCCGEGGMITGLEPSHEKKLKELRWMGISKDTFTRDRGKEVYDWHYEVNSLGFKAHLSDIAATLGRVQLKRLEENISKRIRIVEKYNSAFRELSWVGIPTVQPQVSSSWHIYHLTLDDRDGLMGHLKSLNISSGVHYYPNHLHPYYRNPNSSCPAAEKIWKKIITLPLFPDMTEKQVERVIEGVLGYQTD